MNHKKYSRLRIGCAVLACLCLLSCGGREEETETETVEPGVPSIGVGRSEHTPEVPPEDTGITICIDPGHGFVDAGCSSDYLTEKGYEEEDLTLMYAQMLREELESLGYTVVMTHENDTFPTMPNDNGNGIFGVEERAAYVNTLDVDYLVSLHCDSFEEDFNVGGTRVYYYDTEYNKGMNSDAIASAITDELIERFPNAKKAPTLHNNQAYVILRETKVASSLIEIGFITNNTDVDNLLDPQWQENFVEGVAEGIDSYFSLYQTN